MFKRIAAATMALIIAIMPMTAGAVTWNTVVDSLNTNGSYSGEGISADFNADKTEVTISGNGTLEGEQWGESYYVLNIWSGDISGVTKYVIGDGIVLDADTLMIDVYGDETLTVINKGEFSENSDARLIDLYACDNGQLSFMNEAGAAKLWIFVEDHANIDVNNSGDIDDVVSVDMYDDARATVSGSGEVTDAFIYVNTDSIKDYTSAELAAIVASVGLNAENTVTQLYTMDENGDYEAYYTIAPDGTLTLEEAYVENPEIPENEPELSPKAKEYMEKESKIAREGYLREVKRQAEAIGGVTGSPEWVKQLYLDYMSLNLRVYENGQQELFRERLAWVGDGTKSLSLRVNIDQPQALSIRVDERALDKLEQAGISVITLLAKDGTPIMQYKVSDLRGAYEMYGLAGEDLLVVGGAEDEVMKIGADGQMVPVETEEAAAE